MTSTVRHNLWVLLIALLGVFFAYEAGEMQAEREQAEEIADALNVLAVHRARLEGLLNASLYLTGGLSSLIAVEGGIDKDRFELLARDLISLDPHVRNIALAPDNTISMVYPHEGNEAAVGLHYPDHPQQWFDVARAMDLKTAVLTGPVQLVQGGLGIINRIPIFLRSGPDAGKYWGVVSSVIDFNTLIKAAGLDCAGSRCVFAMRRSEGAEAENEVFWGPPKLFETVHVALDVRLPQTTWTLAMQPRSGWHERPSYQTEAFWVGILLSGLIAALVFMLLRKQRSISHLAMHDSLTELLNRRAFDHRLEEAAARQLRHGGSFAVLHLDLDGFKPINDKLGHAAGDQALRTIAERVRGALRLDDVCARFGGDEFGILVQSSDPSSMHMAEKVAQKILEAINKPMQIDGREVSCSVSIGIAACPEHICEEGGLMRFSDQAMYQAKAAGKGRWMVWNEDAHARLTPDPGVRGLR